MTTQDYYRSYRSNTPLPSIRDVLPDQFGGNARRGVAPASSTLPPIFDPRHGRTSSPAPGGKGSVSANQYSRGSAVPYSFDVLRPTAEGLVHACSSSNSPHGILRSTRVDAGRRYADEEEDVEDSSKRYPCPVCGKRFSRPSSLKAHDVVHTEEKPHQCPFPGCGKFFSVASNMRRHYRKIHENLPDSGEDDHDSSPSPYYASGRY